MSKIIFPLNFGMKHPEMADLQDALQLCLDWSAILSKDVGTRCDALNQRGQEEPTGARSLIIHTISSPAAWEHVAVNTDTIVVVTNVPLSPGKTYVHVIATSNTDAPAKEWAAAIMKAIKESKMVQID